MSESNAEFIECTSLNFNYDNMGLVTVSYTVVHNEKKFVTYKSIDAGGRTFSGYVENASLNPIPDAEDWYETSVAMKATAE